MEDVDWKNEFLTLIRTSKMAASHTAPHLNFSIT